jgi:hypothetical protein
METKYAGYDVNGHRGVAEGRYDGLDKTYGNDMKHIEGTNENLKDLALPFTEFCKLNKVEPVMKIWIGPFTSFRLWLLRRNGGRLRHEVSRRHHHSSNS